METLFTNLLKSSALIAAFYLAYHLLVRKETFFNTNRWFLLTGLFTALLLPWFNITKVVYVEKPKMALADLVAYSSQNTETTPQIPVAEPFDWMSLVWIGYLAIALFLLTRIVINFTSLFRMLHNQQKTKKEDFTLVDLNQNIAPFSFFNYIVYNSSLYTAEELQSILLHEKVHSREKHSFDVMVAKLFCIIFWFNPFVWLYKKAIIQNLEYIADHKAVQQLENPKVYQMALLKAISNQNCLSITNNFYQSLIKKRIVMLNTNQSQQRNAWKYSLILPVLIGFVLLFQIKTIAQEKMGNTVLSQTNLKDEVRLVIDKNTSDADLKRESQRLKEKHGVTLKYSKIKRNDKGEITEIKVEFKDKKGNKGVSQVAGNEPIAPIHFYKNEEAIGFGKPRGMRVYANVPGMKSDDTEAFVFHFDGDSLAEVNDFNFDFDFEMPEQPEFPEMPEMPELPEPLAWHDVDKANILIRKGAHKPLVIINGKVISDDTEIEKAIEEAEAKGEFNIKIETDGNGEDKQVFINGEDIAKIRANAVKNAQIQIQRMKPEMRRQMSKSRELVRKEMLRAREEMEKARPEMERARREMELSKPDMEKAKAEMEKAKAEMLKAKEEMMKAKAELEKA
ncbi:M56 family metallopeptidase, partial [Flavobacterium sp.]|uniref:M56 family metallopeptidase n=1 Tax=Flavobacterium sp. TaxID=239 RepID=UPI0037836FD7